MIDTLELKSKMIRLGYSNKDMAKSIGISATSYSMKLNNIREFKNSEVNTICRILGLDQKERDIIFLATE